jgi:hypothetical protein
MSQSWNRLFIAPTDTAPSPAAVATALQTVLEAQGYDPYDPFPGGTGTPLGLTQMVKLFVAPPQDGWITVLGQFPDELLLDLHQTIKTPVVVGWLSDDSGGFALFADGARHDDPAAFEPYRRASITPETLQRAFAGDLAVEALESDQPPVMAVGADSLPPELRQLAEDQGADPAQASKLFEKMSGKLFKRMSQQTGASPEEREQAQAMFLGVHLPWTPCATLTRFTGCASARRVWPSCLATRRRWTPYPTRWTTCPSIWAANNRCRATRPDDTF